MKAIRIVDAVGNALNLQLCFGNLRDPDVTSVPSAVACNARWVVPIPAAL